MSRNSGFSTDGLLGALGSRPEGLLLLAAGVALMMRSGKPQRQGNRHTRKRQAAQQHADESNESGWNFEGLSNAAGQAREAAGAARNYVTDIADRTVETAGDYASSVSDSLSTYAGRARRGVIDSSEQVAETVQQTVQRVVREQPLAVALIGLAAGAAVAAALPATAVEGRMFGPTKQKLAEAVSHASDQLKSAGAKAGERLAEVADERGLNRDGLKTAASDVAEAFSGALSDGGDQTNPGKSNGERT